MLPTLGQIFPLSVANTSPRTLPADTFFFVAVVASAHSLSPNHLLMRLYSLTLFTGQELKQVVFRGGEEEGGGG